MRFFSSDNFFTRMMNQVRILAAANILFVLCCIPVATAGAGFAALYYTVLCALRENGDIKPIKVFWQGLKENFKQATIAWFALLGMAVLIYLEIFWCGQFFGLIRLFRYGLYAIALALAAVSVYLFPVMSTFRCTLPQLVKNSVGFAFQSPAVMLLSLFLNIVPMAWTFFTNAYMPLYAFLWCTIGFSGIAMLCGKMMLTLFRPYLLEKEPASCVVRQKSEAQILKELRELDG